jgi:hypothetical protein
VSKFLIDDVFARVSAGIGTPADVREIKRRLREAKVPRWVVNAVVRPDRRRSMLSRVVAEGTPVSEWLATDDDKQSRH